MAKKRRTTKEDEEEFDFKMPKFDEEKWLKKERRNIRTLLLSFILGFIIALISFGFWTLLVDSTLRWVLVLVFGIFNASWLRYIFIRLNIDLENFGRKDWFTSYAVYFFTWMLVLIVLVNPPFYDDSPPQVTAVALPGMQEPGGTVQIVARITDNVGVSPKDIHFSVIYPDNTNHTPAFTYNNTIFSYTYENPDNLTGDFLYTLKVKDATGHTTIAAGTFTYDEDTIKLTEPSNADTPPGPEVTYTTQITFDVQTPVERMYYQVNNSDDINISLGSDNYYRTSPQFKGWIPASNVTVNAYAEVIYYFENLETPFTNTITDSTTYYFKTSNALEIGTENSQPITLPQPRFIRTPGFELMIFLVSLIITGLILYYRKKK
jgi:hypothetical protein